MTKRHPLAAALCAVLLAALWIAQPARAVVPGEINYQGLLLDDQGVPLNGNVELIFGLFDVAAGGSALWTETHPTVPVLDGVYDVVLGGTTPLTPSLVAGGELFLEISVEGETLSPRQKLAAVPLALVADTAENANAVGGVSATFVSELFQNFSFDGSDPPNDDPSEGFGDPDSDGLVNFLDPDNDDDGLSDGDEVMAGSDINLVTPTLSGFDPEPAEASAVTTVTVGGTNFDPAMTVAFGSQMPTPQNLTATSFEVDVGPQAAGTATVTLTLPNGEAATSGFLFTSTPPLSISAASTDCGSGSSGNVDTCAVPYPAGVVPGDELLIWLALDSNPDGAACANFEPLTQQGATVELSVFRRTATAAHAGTEACTWNSGDPQSGGAIMTRVTGAPRLRPPLSSREETAAKTSDPPAIPIPVAGTLVVTACAQDGGGGQLSDPPSGYTELLDGVGCDNSGCADASIATRMVGSAGFEDPGPFTNWDQSDESACITLGYDAGALQAPIFAIDWDASSSPESCVTEGATKNQGATDCNCSAGNCPLPQGGESVSIPAQTDGQNKEVGFVSEFGAMAGVSSGCFVVDFELNVDTFSSTSNTSFFEPTSGNGNSGAEIRYLNSGDVVGIRCDDNTLGNVDFALVEDEDYRVRLEYCIDNGPGNCSGIPPGCSDCGCLFVEVASSGNDYGTTQVDECNGSAGPPTVPINGWHFSMSGGTLDLIADDVGICATAPSPGDKCGG